MSALLTAGVTCSEVSLPPSSHSWWQREYLPVSVSRLPLLMPMPLIAAPRTLLSDCYWYLRPRVSWLRMHVTWFAAWALRGLKLCSVWPQRKEISILPLFYHACVFLGNVCAQNDVLFRCCSVAKSWLTLCDSMDCSTPGFPFTISQSLLRLMSIESVMPSNHFIFSSLISPEF